MKDPPSDLEEVIFGHYYVPRVDPKTLREISGRILQVRAQYSYNLLFSKDLYNLLFPKDL